MQYVDVVVKPGKVARCEGKLYQQGQTFRAPARKARLLARLGRVQIDAAGAVAPAVADLPKPTRSDLKEVIAEQRQVTAKEQQEQPSQVPKQDEERPAEDAAKAPGVPAKRARNYQRRDMTANKA